MGQRHDRLPQLGRGQDGQRPAGLTEAAQRVVDRCVQIHGGLGVVRGSGPEELYREVRSLRVYEGASEIQSIVIARAELARAQAGSAQGTEPAGGRPAG